MFFNSINATSIKSKPMNVHFGKRQVFKIVPIADVGGASAGKYFKLELCKPTAALETNKVTLVPYFTVGGTGSAPSVTGGINVAIDLASGDSAANVMTKMQTALAARAEIKLCYVENGALYVEAMWFGKSASIVDGTAGDATTFTFSNEILGYGGFLGATEGGVEITPESEVEDITSDQTGSIPLASIIKSTKFSIKTTVKELTQERMELLFGQLVGEVFTPGSGTKVIGLGTSKVGTNVSAFTGELILKPISKDATDHSENIHFFSCSVLPGALNYGQDVLAPEITFTPYVDNSKDKRANLGCFGDGFQDLRPV